jgi:hypothetical protein
MVIFDQLRISDDGKQLFIDAHVNKSSDFDAITLDSIVIQTQDQISETDPFTPGSTYIYSAAIEGNEKELHLCLDASTDFEQSLSTLSNLLLFVYITCKGTPGPCIPCRLDEMTTLGVTFDENLYYQKVMQFTKELADNCTVSKGFIDMILLWNGFKAAIETEHYIPAIDFWKKLFFGHHGMSGLSNSKPCGCHG